MLSLSELSLSDTLASFAYELRARDLQSASVHSMRYRLLDVLGIGCAARRDPLARSCIALMDEWSARVPARVLGSNQRAGQVGAAFANATLAHWDDFDDTHLPSILHPSATILPTALAIGEGLDRSLGDILAAAAAGYETTLRLGMAGYDPVARDSSFFARGWHATSVCGALGAAVTAAKLLGLTALGIRHALAVAASTASGLLEANRMGGTVKRMHCGLAARSGIMAALAARLGATGPATILEGDMGFLRAFCDEVRPAAITEGLGSSWRMDELVPKRYPVNHFLHPVIDCVAELRRETPACEVDEVVVTLPAPVLKSVAEPRASKLRPESGHAARFSAPFVVATAWLADEPLGLDHFCDAAIVDRERLELAGRVSCAAADRGVLSEYPERLPAIVTVRTRGGEARTVAASEGAAGDSKTLLSSLLDKFHANLVYAEARLEARALARFFAADLVDAPLSVLPWPICDGTAEEGAR